MGRVEGKVAIVTGGASGMGAAIARRIAQEGGRVVVVDRDVERGEAVAAECGEGSRFVEVDVSSDTAWQTLIADVRTREGKLDILVNSAGIVRLSTIEDCGIEEWRAVQAVNADAMFLGCKYAIGIMKETSESAAIVNVISDSAHRPTSVAAAYVSSKGTAMNITRSTALHCAQQKYKIRCNSVLPGVIDTPMLRNMLSTAPNSDELLAALLSRYPLGRMGDSDEVAAAALFLASDEASYITGIGLPVDGGCTLV